MSFVIGLIGVIVILCGTIQALVDFVRLELKNLRGLNICHQRELIRHHFGAYILLGLEFLIADDIVDTIRHPGLQETLLLGQL